MVSPIPQVDQQPRDNIWFPFLGGVFCETLRSVRVACVREGRHESGRLHKRRRLMHELAMLLGLMQPQVTAASSPGVLWQIGDPAITANTGQCGVATHPTGTSAEFVLVKNTGCMRNQLNPVGNGGSGVFLLDSGQTYTWNFQTVTHMGIDVGKYTQRLVWQIHDYGCGLSPVTVLGIQNFAGGKTGKHGISRVATAPKRCLTSKAQPIRGRSPH